MKVLARRKIVFVIVEGASDDTALGVALNQVFDKDMVYIHIVHGDITTKAGVTPLNIVSRIGDMIEDMQEPGIISQVILNRFSTLLIRTVYIFLTRMSL